MTHLNLGPMSRSDLDVYIRASSSPNYQPFPEFSAVAGHVDLPPTAAEIEAYARRKAARAALRADAVASGDGRRATRGWRPVQAVRRALLERKRGRVAPEEGVGVGAA